MDSDRVDLSQMRRKKYIETAISELRAGDAKIIQEFLKKGSIGMMEWDEDSEVLCPIELRGANSTLYRKLNDGQMSLCLSLIKSNRDHLYEMDVTSAPDYQEGDSRTKSEFIARLGKRSQRLGVLDCQHSETDYFSDAVRIALMDLAKEISLMLLYDLNIRSRTYIRQVNESLSILETEASRPELRATTGKDAFKAKVLGPAKEINRWAHSATQGHSRVIYIPLDTATRQPVILEAVFTGGRLPPLESEISSDPVSNKGKLEINGMVGGAAYLRRNLLIHDLGALRDDDGRCYINTETEDGAPLRVLFVEDKVPRKVKSALAVPVIGQNDNATVHGVLYLDHRKAYAYSSIEVDYLESIAKVLAITLDDIQKVSKLHALGSGYTAACVMARNLAHHIGSHALTYVIADLDQHRILSTPATLDPVLAEKFNRDRRAIRELLAHIRDRVLFAAIQPHALFGTFGNLYLEDKLKLVYPETDGFLPSNLVRSKLGGTSSEPKAFISWPVSAEADAKMVSIPHGQLGLQALCAILENLIRNAANYASAPFLKEVRKDEGYLQMKGRVVHDWHPPEHIIATSPPENSMRWSLWQSEYAEIRITDNSPKPVDFDVSELGLDARVASFTGTRGGAAGNLGMLEIKFCAAYLRGVSPSEVDDVFEKDKDYLGEEPPFVHVCVNPLGNLEYRVYVKRPRNVLFIFDGADRVDESKKLELFQAGCSIASPQECLSKIDANSALREDLAIIGNCSSRALRQLAQASWFLPYRLLMIDSNISEWKSLTKDREASEAHVFGISQPELHKWESVLSPAAGSKTYEDVFADMYDAYITRLKSTRSKSQMIVSRWSTDLFFPKQNLLCISETSWSNVQSAIQGLSEDTPLTREVRSILSEFRPSELLAFDHQVLSSREDSLYMDSGYWDALAEPSDVRSVFMALLLGNKTDEAEPLERVTEVSPQNLINIGSLFEAALTTVLVVDDRIESMQSDPVSDSTKGKLDSLGSDGVEEKVSMKEAWSKRRVRFFSEKAFIEQAANQSVSPRALIESIMGQKYTDISLIHQQMLKTLSRFADDGTMSKTRLNDIVLELMKRSGRLIVHTSTGEVNPTYVRRLGMLNVPWLSYNEIQDVLLNKGKVELVRALFALRGVKR